MDSEWDQLPRRAWTSLSEELEVLWLGSQGLQGLQPHTVAFRTQELCGSKICLLDPQLLWVNGCAKAWAHTCIHVDFQPGLMRID